VLLSVREAKIEPLLGKTADLPPPLVDVLSRALARDPGDRFRDAAEFRAAIEKASGTMSEATLGDAVHWALHFSTSGTLRTEPDDRFSSGEEHEPTPARADQKYVFFHDDGSFTESLDYAAAVELLATGRLPHDALVSVDDAPAVPALEVEAFARHLGTLVQEVDPQRTPAPEAAGRLEERSVASVLGRLALSRASGLVLFEKDPVCKEVYLVQGRPEYVSSNVGAEMFGEFLVRERVLSRADVDRALARLPAHGGRLGEALIGLGLLQPLEVVRQIASQVRAKLLELFQWRGGRYSFFRGARAPKGWFPLGLDPIGIVCEGVRHGTPLSELSAWFAARKTMRVGIAPDVGAAVLAALPPFEERVIRSFAEPIDLGAVQAMHPGIERVNLFRALYLGIEMGLLVETEFVEVD
jgi:serine/threonine-protein kinase